MDALVRITHQAVVLARSRLEVLNIEDGDLVTAKLDRSGRVERAKSLYHRRAVNPEERREPIVTEREAVSAYTVVTHE